MISSGLLSSVKNNLLEKLLYFPDEWLSACVEWLQEENKHEVNNVSIISILQYL